MKTLPTVELEDSMYDRILAVFGDEDQYISWLANAISSRISSSEGQPLLDEAMSRQFEIYEEIRLIIDPPVEEPIIE